MWQNVEKHTVSPQKEKLSSIHLQDLYIVFFFPVMFTNPFPLPHLPLSFSDRRGILEVAVTGTVVPVNLCVEPGTTLDFGECPAGSTNTQQIQVGSA